MTGEINTKLFHLIHLVAKDFSALLTCLLTLMLLSRHSKSALVVA